MKKLIEFLFCEEVNDFKKFFVDEIIKRPIKYRGIPVTFDEEDFNHICYETGQDGVSKSKFGIRRARRILIIKQLLIEDIPSELLFEQHSGNYCLLCAPLDLAVFLVPIKQNKTLQIGTIIHYGEGFTKAIQKQRSKSKIVTKIVF